MGELYGIDGFNLTRFLLDYGSLAALPVPMDTSLPLLKYEAGNIKEWVVAVDGKSVDALANTLFANPTSVNAKSSPNTWAFELLEPADKTTAGGTRTIFVAPRTFAQVFERFDGAWRWSNLVFVIVFVVLGMWVYFLRPYESSAIGMLVLGVCTGIYQFFQSFTRQISSLTQPFVFWNDFFIMSLFGVTIFGALIHIGLVFPQPFTAKLNIRGKTYPTWKWIVTAYLGMQALFWVPAAIIFLRSVSPAQKLNDLQQLWQVVQVTGFTLAALIGVLHYHLADTPKDKTALKLVVISGIAVSLFIILAEKLLLLVVKDPLFDGNMRKLVLLAFPLMLAREILRRKIFEIDRIMGRAFLSSMVMLFFCALQVLLVSLVIGMLNIQVGPLATILLSSLSLLVSSPLAPLAMPFYRRLENLFFDKQLSAPELVQAIEKSFDLSLAPEMAMRKATEAITKSLGLEKAEIALAENAGVQEEGAASLQAVNTRVRQIPLSFQGQELGHLVLTFAPDRVFYLNREIRELIGHELGAMLYAVRISENLRNTQKRAQVVEKKQQSMRQHLHDGLGAELGGMVLGIDATKNLLESGNLPEASNLLNLIKKTSVGMVAEVRTIARMDEGQMPAELAQLGLEKSLSSFLQSFTGRFEPTLDARLPARRLPPDVEAAVYFITREAVNNVAKHANASRCAISIEARQGDKVKLTIADDGRGPGQMVVPGAGMQSMRQRASDLGGTFEIGDNKPGTVLRVDIPLRNTD
ncbi:MAG TPA: hypothetical protein PLJ62_10825 [Thermoflexales bacterium]|nr:hypothetical protein [Thermoflexales bacterium]HQZ21372.1 hypothetical protein [Thermoflexales bacterium]HRA00684.1 hypothetical protein [Thermoflexales bacterium]